MSALNLVRGAIVEDAYKIARLHQEELKNGFLANTGVRFLTLLYHSLIKNEHVLVYEEASEIKGFVSFSENSRGMMFRFIKTSPKAIIFLILNVLASPSMVIKLIETFNTPFKTIKTDKLILPDAELLSIAVQQNCKSSGLGSLLVKELESYLQVKNIFQYKVIAGYELQGANQFYLKNGFEMVAQVRIHGNAVSNVYTKKLPCN